MLLLTTVVMKCRWFSRKSQGQWMKRHSVIESYPSILLNCWSNWQFGYSLQWLKLNWKWCGYEVTSVKSSSMYGIDVDCALILWWKYATRRCEWSRAVVPRGTLYCDDLIVSYSNEQGGPVTYVVEFKLEKQGMMAVKVTFLLRSGKMLMWF